MAIPHAQAGEPVSIQPAPGSPDAGHTTTLIKTASLEVIRMVLPAGKELASHEVPGEITLQCVSGCVTLKAGSGSRELSSGMLTYLAGGQKHALTAKQDSTVLVTILLVPKGT